MSTESSKPQTQEVKPPRSAEPADGTALARVPVAPSVSSKSPAAQLGDLPVDELEHFAEELGLEPKRYKTRQHLVAAIHERRQVISTMEREAMLDVVRWGRRPVPVNASREQIALEIARIKSMRFEGLSLRGLKILAQLRGVDLRGDEGLDAIIRRLHKNEGMFARFARRRRAWVGRVVAGMMGEAEPTPGEYQFIPPPSASSPGTPAGSPPTTGSIADEIEDQGLFGGLASRVKRTADSYLNQKLDEIEQRIDRKLDEIDRRLAEWRDREIANRIRIIKITLWASVAVAAVSLLYSYIVVLSR